MQYMCYMQTPVGMQLCGINSRFNTETDCDSLRPCETSTCALIMQAKSRAVQLTERNSQVHLVSKATFCATRSDCATSH